MAFFKGKMPIPHPWPQGAIWCNLLQSTAIWYNAGAMKWRFGSREWETMDVNAEKLLTTDSTDLAARADLFVTFPVSDFGFVSSRPAGEFRISDLRLRRSVPSVVMSPPGVTAGRGQNEGGVDFPGSRRFCPGVFMIVPHPRRVMPSRYMSFTSASREKKGGGERQAGRWWPGAKLLPD